jgi:hypothetical protein
VPILSPSPIKVLIDSGCTRSFIDKNLIDNNFSCKAFQIFPPLTLKLFDGSVAPSGPITTYTDLDFQVPGLAPERFRFLATRLDSSVSLALGHDWLHARNPIIDWKAGRLVPRASADIQKDVADTPDSSPILADAGQALPLPLTPCSADDPVPKRPHVSLIGAAAFLQLAYDSPILVGSMSAAKPREPTSAASGTTGTTPDAAVEDDLSHIPACYHDFADVFSKAKANVLPPHRPYDHTIDLEPESTIPYGPIYRLSEIELAALRDFIEEYTAKGFIRPSKSPAGAPILFVKKKDGSLRLCVDYRSLNKITRKDRYPLPRIDELLDRLRSAYIFTKLDLRSGYNLVRMREGDEWKTAFRTRYGSYEFLVLHFGLTNAPATFQHFMNDAFRSMLDDFLEIYLDDLIVFTTPELDESLPTSLEPSANRRHVEQVRKVLTTMRDNGLYASPKKCVFHVNTVDFLGYVVSPAGLSMDPAKCKVIADWPIPKSVKDVQSFHGFANFYRRFVTGYSKITKPLTNLTRKEVPFVWSAQCQAAFEALKSAFTSAGILAHFQPEFQTVVETDASDYAVAAVLSQEHPETKELRPVAFYSRSMTPAELNYEIYDKELLAIFAAFKEWRSYLEGSVHTVRVVTDHKNLEYFATTKLLTRRQARWSEYLSGFNYVVYYRPGRLGGKPDALTRRPDVYPKGGDGAYALANPQNMQTIFKDGQLIESLRASYILTPDVRPSDSVVILRATILDIDTLRTDIIAELANDATVAERLADRSEPWSMSATGLLLFNLRVYVPDARDLRLRVIQNKHDHETAGHQGFRKTLDLVRREFYWPGLRTMISDFCRTCDMCPRNKAARHKPYGLLKQLPIPERPWESISVDFIGELPASVAADSGITHNAILVVVDRLSKMSLFIPTTTTAGSADLARLYVRHVFSKHGVPSDIVSDRGSTFTSQFMSALGRLLNIKMNYSTAYHPETDGQTERTNQTLESYLRMYTNYQQDDWADLLPIAEFAYNNAPHSATQVSPFFANYGYNPRATLSLDVSVPDPSAHDFSKTLSELHRYCREQVGVAQSQYQTPADRRRLPAPNLVVGDLVWLNAKNITTQRPSKKLDHKRLGPFAITSKISTHAFRLDLPRGMRFIHPVFHVSLLEPHRPNTVPNREQPPPPPVEIDGDSEYEVSAILDSRRRRRRLEYYVQWRGYENTAESATWEPADNLSNSPELIAAFHTAYPNKPSSA